MGARSPIKRELSAEASVGKWLLQKQASILSLQEPIGPVSMCDVIFLLEQFYAINELF